jgi:NTP pyrophosphatase (non-canonical NTP hydrolase)
MDNLGFKWKTTLGEFELTKTTTSWIIANSKSSMFNNERCFIYNKAFYESFLNPKHTPCSDPEISRFNLIRDWAKQRGIVDKGNSHTQYVKLMEEAGELAEALLKKDRKEIYDAIGDMIVVLTNLATLEDMKIEDCIDYAYNEIASRKGKMINGTFVKNTL